MSSTLVRKRSNNKLNKLELGISRFFFMKNKERLVLRRFALKLSKIVVRFDKLYIE